MTVIAMDALVGSALSRRAFVGAAAGMVSSVRVGLVRPKDADYQTRAGPIRLDNNENPYGPFPSARAAMTAAIAEGGRYPSVEELQAAIAKAEGVGAQNVLLTVGATEGLNMAARAFTSASAPLVTAAPTYAAIATATEQLGHPVVRVPLTPEGKLDLTAMADKASGAGVVYVCNPNNPTGTTIPTAALREFFRRISEVSPNAVLVIGEAYHEYVDDMAYETCVGPAVKDPGMLVNRTFSKLYGLAGLRLGYLVGHEDTLATASAYRVPIGVNSIAAAAATASLTDAAERRRQREMNRAGRDAAARFFSARGLRTYDAAANFLFVDIGRDITAFRALCRDKGLLVGRLYPPMTTWMRLTIGTPEEMVGAFDILAALL
ncbi:MAG: aminotransferase class I/II-fold pyridoxal phosphate-dependent enzyme [Gemmatimonadaceae bacterium]